MALSRPDSSSMPRISGGEVGLAAKFHIFKASTNGDFYQLPTQLLIAWPVIWKAKDC